MEGEGKKREERDSREKYQLEENKERKVKTGDKRGTRNFIKNTEQNFLWSNFKTHKVYQLKYTKKREG